MPRIISAFPGTGKTYLHNLSILSILDSDSSKFSWIAEGVRNPNFPNEYIRYIRSRSDVEMILVSTHKEVREALAKENIHYGLVFPERNLKDEYLNRFMQRGDSEKFIELINHNWDSWITDLEEQKGCLQIRLRQGEYLTDLLYSGKI